MKKWVELKSKGRKYERICQATVSCEIRNLIQISLEDYRKTKDPNILDGIRSYLLKRKRKFSKENIERIECLLE